MTRLVLLSGWGVDTRVWRPLARHWPAGVTIAAPDWPGYGGRPPLASPTDLDALAATMADELHPDAVWVGWSLGGLLAASLLRRLPTSLVPPRGLILLGMGPTFCHPGGVGSRELAAFHHAFARDPAAALAHFRRWMLGGEASPGDTHRLLRDLLHDDPSPDAASLAAGLHWLATLDIGDTLAAPPCPVRTLAGADDPLLAETLRQGADRHIHGAGHCPMLSRPAELAEGLVVLARECLTNGASSRPEGTHA